MVPFTFEINNLIAYYNTFPVSVSGPAVTIKAQLYEADEMSNIFSPIDETLVTLSPSITDATPGGTLLRGESGINRVVEKNKKLMLVFSATSSGSDPINQIMGYVSATLVYT